MSNRRAITHTHTHKSNEAVTYSSTHANTIYTQADMQERTHASQQARIQSRIFGRKQAITHIYTHIHHIHTHIQERNHTHKQEIQQSHNKQADATVYSSNPARTNSNKRAINHTHTSTPFITFSKQAHKKTLIQSIITDLNIYMHERTHVQASSDETHTFTLPHNRINTHISKCTSKHKTIKHACQHAYYSMNRVTNRQHAGILHCSSS